MSKDKRNSGSLNSFQISLNCDRTNVFKEKVDFVSSIFESLVGYAIIAADFDGKIIAFNKGACLIYGYAANEVINKKNIEILWPKEFIDTEKQVQIIDDLLNEERVSLEGTMVRKNGDSFLAGIQLILSKSSDGIIVGYILIIVDLTEKLQAETRRRAEARRQADVQQRIKQLDEEIGVMRQISKLHRASMATRMYSEISLMESAPDIFDELVRQYTAVIELKIEQITYKGRYNISEELQTFAMQLGHFKGGPRDVIDIHRSSLKTVIGRSNSKKSKAYLEEGRIIVLELMGHLVSYYRSGSSVTGNQRP